MICLFCIVVAIALLIVLFVVVSLLYLYCYLVVLRCIDVVWLELVVLWFDGWVLCCFSSCCMLVSYCFAGWVVILVLSLGLAIYCLFLVYCLIGALAL